MFPCAYVHINTHFNVFLHVHSYLRSVDLGKSLRISAQSECVGVYKTHKSESEGKIWGNIWVSVWNS